MGISEARHEQFAPGGRALAAEATLVGLLTVGVSIAGSLRFSIAARAAVAFTNVHLGSLVVFEIVLAAILVPWLHRRGWRPRAIAGDPGPVDLLRGAGLWMFALACFAVSWFFFAALQPEWAQSLAHARQFTGIPAAPVVAIVTSVINPVFEEFLWLGYGVTRLAPSIGLRRASALSVLLRTVVHLYQGPLALIAILPLGLAFTWYHARTRRLWPIVVAHVLFDAIALASRLAAG